MGSSLVAIAYFLFMLIGHSLQVYKNYKTKKTKDLSAGYFALVWTGVVLRVANGGILWRDTWHFNAIVQALTDATVVILLGVILAQTLWYSRRSRR